MKLIQVELLTETGRFYKGSWCGRVCRLLGITEKGDFYVALFYKGAEGSPSYRTAWEKVKDAPPFDD